MLPTDVPQCPHDTLSLSSQSLLSHAHSQMEHTKEHTGEKRRRNMSSRKRSRRKRGDRHWACSYQNTNSLHFNMYMQQEIITVLHSVCTLTDTVMKNDRWCHVVLAHSLLLIVDPHCFLFLASQQTCLAHHCSNFLFPALVLRRTQHHHPWAWSCGATGQVNQVSWEYSNT